MSNPNEAFFSSCTPYIDTIMDSVEEILNRNNIHYETEKNNVEILILDSTKTRDEIQDLIERSLEIPKMITAVLLSIKEAKNTIFIRLQLK